MSNKEQPSSEHYYPDLPDGQHDPALAQLITHLDTLYNVPQRPTYVSWVSLKARSNQAKLRPLPHASFRPTHARLSLRTSIILAIVLLALTFGTAYAHISGLIDQLLNHEAGIRYLQQNHQFVDTNMTQTSNGITVTIQKVYSDNNRAIVVYTVQTTRNQKNLFDMHASGAMYFEQGKYSNKLRIVSDDFGKRNGNNSETYVTSFDVTNIQGNPSLLHLKYVINSIHFIQLVNPISTPTVQGQRIQTTEQDVKGLWTFELTVPFHAGQTIMLGQNQTYQGRTFTLDKIIISQSETQVYLRGLSIYDLALRGANLTIGNTSQRYLAKLIEGNRYPGGIIIVFPDALANKSGNWTLNLPMTLTNNPMKIDYTLTFHFTVSGK